jgi:hypothetical protein
MLSVSSVSFVFYFFVLNHKKGLIFFQQENSSTVANRIFDLMPSGADRMIICKQVLNLNTKLIRYTD